MPFLGRFECGAIITRLHSACNDYYIIATSQFFQWSAVAQDNDSYFPQSSDFMNVLSQNQEKMILVHFLKSVSLYL